MPTFATMPTPNGHLAGEVASALQKSLRRGLERESLYFASELDLAGFPDYLWRRLRIIASEDVGMADPQVAVQVRALSLNYAEQRRHNAKSKTGTRSGERLFIAQAVMILARAPKWRGVDHAVMAVWEGDREPIEIPDYALDRHTARGRKRGRAWEHFFTEAARLENESDLPDPYAEMGQAVREGHRPATPDDHLRLDL
jgi:replication-associated recombination protein RarA